MPLQLLQGRVVFLGHFKEHMDDGDSACPSCMERVLRPSIFTWEADWDKLLLFILFL